MKSKSPIPDVYPIPEGMKFDDCFRIMHRTDKKVADFFNRGIFAGEQGRLILVFNVMLKRLHEQCVADGIEGWQEGDSERRLAELLERMNFNKPEVVATPVKKPRAKKPKADPNIVIAA